jgi:mechanosensitive ion channel-like protein
VYLSEQVPTTRVLPGIDDEAEAPTQSRLATALPLVRSAVLGVVIGVTALIVLSTLGVDIGPLLAGFGVIGLAISFGSQALVRDIMSGIPPASLREAVAGFTNVSAGARAAAGMSARYHEPRRPGGAALLRGSRARDWVGVRATGENRRCRG